MLTLQNKRLCTLQQVSSWQKVPQKEKIWEYVLEKYDVPDAAKKWVLTSIGQSYKVHKCRFKQKHFYHFKDNKTRWKNRPKHIPEDDFAQLLHLWSRKDVEKRCLQAKESRMSQKNMHTAGPKSFARIREEMKNEDPDQELPTLSQLFERTRKRTEGREYVDTYDDTAKKICKSLWSTLYQAIHAEQKMHLQVVPFKE
ncbi:hypothetical protein QVD17_08553 [Tagetes erecta]|uniref:Uncharacterized protein n=1 Tax=Tagetes erecta TaxID=13708 RepID=A0AAD8P4B2_TARER|nr:hypothetical protein QVD17_08553 [Tagetes erecta]